MKPKHMKKIILVAMAALAVAACNSKSVEEKLAEFTEWNQNFMEHYRTRLTALQDQPEAAEAFADSAYQAYMDYNKAALEEIRINHAQKEAQLVKLHSASAAEKRLHELGSNVALPKEPATLIKKK